MVQIAIISIQWNPSCEATSPVPEMCPFNRGDLSSGVEIKTFMFRFTLSSGLSRGGGLSSVWPLKRGSILCDIEKFTGSFVYFVTIPSYAILT